MQCFPQNQIVFVAVASPGGGGGGTGGTHKVLHSIEILIGGGRDVNILVNIFNVCPYTTIT